MNIKPTGYQLLVGPVKRPDPGKKEILIPDNAKYQGEHDREFWVIAVGPKVKDIQPRDRVILTTGHHDVDYLLNDPQRRGMVHASSVLAILGSERYAETETPSPTDTPA